MLVDSQKIRVFRVRARLSLPGLARKSGVSRSHAYYIEKHGRTTEEMAGKIADALGVSIEALLPDPPHGTVHEQVESGLYTGPSAELLQLSVAKVEKAGLDEEETAQMRRTIAMVIDIFTALDPAERKKHVVAITGIMQLCHLALFPLGGRENVPLSPSEEEEKA